MTTEQDARGRIDQLLGLAGWSVRDPEAANIHASRGVAIREFPLKASHGFADYLLYVDGQAAGIIEAKKEGLTLTGVETQSAKYTQGLPDGLPAWPHPLPFSYQSTGTETRFTNGLDPDPRSRPVFAFHQPATLAAWLEDAAQASSSSDTEGQEGEQWPKAAEAPAAYGARPSPSEGEGRGGGGTFLARMSDMPALHEEDLWPAQIKAINNLEQSLRENRPRALIQMATGSGKTFTAISFIYRLVKFAGARRVLFLVDRGNLGDQTLKEFQQYASPYNNFKFSEEYIVQRLSSNTLDTTARVCICTIQRMYSMLKGKELPEDLEEESVDQLTGLFKQPEPIEYNPQIPIETFDIIVTDECHRSIYNLWAQVLEYFDAYLIGRTATPSKQTFGFFHQNLVMEYNHEMAVADGVNVNYDVYRIRTKISEAGSKVEAGYPVQIQERDTRKKRWEELDDDFEYDPNRLDRDVVAPDQIRKIIQTYRDKLFTEIFPGREWVPKTLIFAKDDAHADEVRKYALRDNDILVLRVNGSPDLVSRFVLVRHLPEAALYCDHFIRARCASQDLAMWLRSYSDVDRFRRYIDVNKVSSAGQNTINQGVLCQFTIPLPPINEQRRIIAEDRRLSILGETKAQVNDNHRRSEHLRQANLETAFSGQLIRKCWRVTQGQRIKLQRWS